MTLLLDNIVISNSLFLGTALYPNLEIMKKTIENSNVQVITLSLRRQIGDKKNNNNFWNYIKTLNCHLLPNTAGCFNAKEAVYTANMARELFETNWIKLEVIGDNYTLQPHPFELLKACEILINQGFFVFPYCTEDLILCQHLVALGCQVLMPWGAPIGTGKGLLNPYALAILRERLSNTVLIIDAGIGSPAHAAHAMQLGFDAVLLNSAVALAEDPIKMAQAFVKAIEAGKLAFEAGIMPSHEFAKTSTPLIGKPFEMS